MIIILILQRIWRNILTSMMGYLVLLNRFLYRRISFRKHLASADYLNSVGVHAVWVAISDSGVIHRLSSTGNKKTLSSCPFSTDQVGEGIYYLSSKKDLFYNLPRKQEININTDILT